MEGTSQSSRKRQNVSPPIDRLSALPNGVICRILSFLPTKLSASTSILAKRWRFLWAHVPSLYFSSSELRIIDIINRVMLLYKVESMNSLRLFYHGGAADDRSKFQLETCMIAAISRNIKKLEIFFHDPAILPRCIFTCKTLVDLTLRFCGYIPTTGTVCLPALKRLNLSLVSYESDKSLVNLLFGCPVLEELTISNKSSSDCFDISSLTIKRLTVGFTFDWDNIYWKVKINAPALRYLKVNNCLRKRISVSPMNSLTEADIRLKIYSLDSGDNMPSQVKFLDCLRNVKCLRLAGYIDKAVTESIVKFDNLTKLELDLVVDWRLLLKLLESADNLEALVVSDVDISLTFWEEPERVPTCLLLHLRIIRTGPICGKHEFNMLRYLARNAKVLKAIDLRSTHCSKAQLDVIKRILLFKRGYEACMLV
ncbi:fbd-associated F-box protein at5g38590 [Phtheirospermum japonicum]|uniref:Fbd-associated F-box protein at5g38590 n=1 Tax=Phtheirospermum japonicum TaxID=374723 RepID=A0A830D8D9_9LAMI|nr:fbd-associated F-box protein at5g38590 [Phtheirospermum japonicum]